MILNHSKLTDRLSGALHIVVLLDSVHDPLVGGVGGDKGDVVVVLLVLIQPEVVVHHVASGPPSPRTSCTPGRTSRAPPPRCGN